MIDKKEIEAKSHELEIHTSNVQRDYVFGWLLSGIYRNENNLRDKLILKGGNCFRKAYFEHSRFSNDLDFSTQVEIDLTELQSGINAACEYAGEKRAYLLLLIKTL